MFEKLLRGSALENRARCYGCSKAASIAAIHLNPHVVASLVDRWRGPHRDGWRVVLDYKLAIPGAATLTFLGRLLKPLLARRFQQ